MENKIIGGYQIGSVIGIGTYGEVRHGLNVVTGDHVALKIVDLNRFEEETAIIMLKEIKILKMLKHKHCIRIIEIKENQICSGKWCNICACSYYDCHDENDINSPCKSCGHYQQDHSSLSKRNTIFIVQELAAGGEFFSILMHCGAFREDIACYYFKQLIDGLEYLHNQGIIHRDLKPENLVLDAEFNLKIVDFGLASIINKNTTTKAVLHSGVGSQPYSAPEVYYIKELYGNQGYDGEAADIWSTAVILFVMLTGRPPFLRPLDKTYGSDLRRCKHYINILKGKGYNDISTTASDLLKHLFIPNPKGRLNIKQIKKHIWLQTNTPSQETVINLMEDKAQKVWLAQDKPKLADILKKMRLEHINQISSSSTHNRDIDDSPNMSPIPKSIMDMDDDDDDDQFINNTPHPAQDISSSSSSSFFTSPSSINISSMPQATPDFNFHMIPTSIDHNFNPFPNAKTDLSTMDINQDEEPIYRHIKTYDGTGKIITSSDDDDDENDQQQLSFKRLGKYGLIMI